MTCDPSNALCSGRGFFLPNLVATGHFLAIWPLVDPSWPLTPEMHYTLVRGSSHQIGSHRAFLSNLTSGWPKLTSAWPLTPQCITLWSGVLPTLFGSHRAFLSNLTSGWPQLTPTWPLTQHYITLWLGVLPTKFGSHRAFFSNLTSGWPLHDLWPQHCTFWSGVLHTKFGSHRAFVRHFDLWMTFDGVALKLCSHPWGLPPTPCQVLAQYLKHDEIHSQIYSHTDSTDLKF